MAYTTAGITIGYRAVCECVGMHRAVINDNGGITVGRREIPLQCHQVQVGGGGRVSRHKAVCTAATFPGIVVHRRVRRRRDLLKPTIGRSIGLSLIHI